MTTRLFLIRHGETNATASDTFSGDQNVHLTDEGRAQVEQLARRLAQEKVAALYSSTADRAMATAAILGQPHALVPIPTDDLREISSGHWEGLTLDEVRTRFPVELADWQADPMTCAAEGGDPGISVLARALPAIHRIVVDHPGETVMVVSHQGTLRLLVSSLLGFDPREYRRRLNIAPASLTILEFKDPLQARLLLFNDISHYSAHPPEPR